MFLDELTAYLVTQLGGSWAEGTNVHKISMPKDDGSHLALYPTSGEPAHQTIAVYRYRFRLLSKAEDMATAVTNWQTAFDILNRAHDITFTSYDLALITALDSNPYPLRNEPGDFLLESDFRASYKNRT